MPHPRASPAPTQPKAEEHHGSQQPRLLAQRGVLQQGAVAVAQDVSAQELQEMYNQPATLPDREVMTVEDTIVKSAAAFAVLLVGAAIGWVTDHRDAVPLWGAAIVGFVLALVNIFKKEPSPPLILAYAGVQGIFVGGISLIYEWPTRHRRAGRPRHPRRGRRDAGAVRHRQGPRLEAGHQGLPHRDGRLPGVLARQHVPHVVRRAPTTRGASAAPRSSASRSACSSACSS